MSSFHRAFDLCDNSFNRAQKRNDRKRYESFAYLVEFSQRIVVGSYACKLEFHIPIKESSSGSIREKNLGIDAVSVECFEPGHRIVDFERDLLPALRIITA